MKVKDLRKLLVNMDGDALVVLASDAEGNDFSILYEVDEMKYVPETPTSGQVYEIDEVEEEEIDDSVNAVVMWP